MERSTLGVMVLAIAMLLSPSLGSAKADAAKTAKEATQDVKKKARKAGRTFKDKTCELVDGKMNCLGKKAKHKAENVGDEISDKVN